MILSDLLEAIQGLLGGVFGWVGGLIQSILGIFGLA